MSQALQTFGGDRWFTKHKECELMMGKRFSLGWFVVAGLVFGCAVGIADGQLVPYDPNTMSYPISPAEALQAARDWAGDPDLELVLVGVEGFSEFLVTDHRYLFVTPDGNQGYQVNCTSGRVVRWIDKPATDASGVKLADWDPATQLPDAQLRAIAESFLRTHYTGFEALNMQPLEPEGPNSEYVQRLPNGVWNYLNRALCDMDYWTGQVCFYYGLYGGDPTISTTPLVDAEEAEEIAIDYAGTREICIEYGENENVYGPPRSVLVLKNWGAFLSSDGMVQRVHWVIDLFLSDEPGYTAEDYAEECSTIPHWPSGQELTVLVDAHTGEVAEEDSGGLAGSSRKISKTDASRIKIGHPNPARLKLRTHRIGEEATIDGKKTSLSAFPVLNVDGCKYVYAKYLPALYGGILEWRQSAARMSVAGKKVVLWPGSTDISIEGKRVSLKDPVKIIAGRTYVPLEAFKVICGAEATWDKEAKVLRIVSGPIKPKAQFRRIASTVSSDRSERSGMP
ncbi:MAG: copper amine oxidase N-terminal domain-containing protein [Armatimonadetes bacterium]|nr:copper amine oxidase N-terminal domain-containing protein [Armatimonadota bacterium]